jgi:hypothetical protein
MGNISLTCLDNTGINKGEFRKSDMADYKDEGIIMSDEYRKKSTSDEILKEITLEKSRPPQQARTYDNGTVKVSVF